MIFSKVFSFGNDFVGNITVAASADERFPMFIKTTFVHTSATFLAALENHVDEILKVDFSVRINNVVDNSFVELVALVYQLVLECRHQPKIWYL